MSIERFRHAMCNGELGRLYSPETVNSYIGILTRYFQRFPTFNLDGCQDFLFSIPTMPARIQALKVLRLFATTQKDYEQCLNELQKMNFKNTNPVKQDVLTEEELIALLKAAGPHKAPVFATMGMTGLRVSELCNLKFDDVDLDKRTIFTIGKGNKPRKVGIPDGLFEFLHSYNGRKAGRTMFFSQENNEPIYPRLVRYWLSNISRIAIGRATHPHALRRSFVTINHHKGRPLAILQAACGHSSITITRRYCITTENDVTNQMKGW